MKHGDIIELKIDSVAFGGAGVGRYLEDEKEFVVFVDDAISGDVVKAYITKKKKNFAFANVAEIIKKSHLRIEPFCKHFGTEGDRCGGCSFQYLSYENQLKIKEQNVKDAISRIGGFNENLVLPIIGCENNLYYRNKMEFSFSRTKNGDLTLGLHVKKRRYDVTDLTECFLFSDWVGEFISNIRIFFIDLDKKGVFNDVFKPISLVVREGKRTGEIMLNLVVENGVLIQKDEFRDVVLKILNEKNVRSIYLTTFTNKKGYTKKIDEEVLFGEKIIKEKMILSPSVTLNFEILPQSFFQPNTLQAEILYKTVINFLSPKKSDFVYDLYCGAGTISLALSSFCKKIYGIELNKSAIINAKNNLKLNNINNVEFYEGDVGKVVSELDEKPNLVVLDPPRNGLSNKAISDVIKLKSKKIVYVSCNPNTLARDLKIFKENGYNLLRSQPLDMFPHTYHIETVSELVLV